MTNLARLLVVVPLVLACNPEFDNRFSSIDAPRVLAVQSSPAEAAPGKAVSYQILVADPRGTIADPRVDWSFCTQAKPVNELNDVATACFGTGDNVLPFAMGATARAKIPSNACRQFGPDIPMTMPGEPSARPTDADTTGGYYQPLILTVHDTGQAISTLAETRITCSLASSTGTQDEDYQKRTKPNENPALSSVVVTSMGDAPLTDVGDAGDAGVAVPLSVPHGAKITLRASWPSCPVTPSCGDGMCTSGETVVDCPDDCTTPVGCNGPEEYAYLDPEQGALVDRHESMRVSWFASAGEFDDDHTGRLEEEFAVSTSDNGWRAPASQGAVFMWVVLRDDRGGVDFHSFEVQVE
jgi:hypothetical protein